MVDTNFKYEIIFNSKMSLKTNYLPELKLQNEIKSIIIFTYKEDGFIKSAVKMDLKKVFNNLKN